MSKINPKEFVHKTAYSVQLPYIAGHSLKENKRDLCFDLMLDWSQRVATMILRVIFYSYYIGPSQKQISLWTHST